MAGDVEELVYVTATVDGDWTEYWVEPATWRKALKVLR